LTDAVAEDQLINQILKDLPMQRLLIVCAISLLVGALIIISALLWTTRNPAAAAINLPSSSSAEPPQGETPPQAAKPTNAEVLLEERKQTDETVWHSEVVAQEYENTFIALWDSMRRRLEDQHLILAAQPFTSLSIRRFAPEQDIGWNLSLSKSTGDANQVTPDEWKTLVSRLAGKGYVLEHSEWHHSAFDLLADGSAKSDISMKLFIANKVLQQRLAVSGTLHIKWTKDLDRRGLHIPGDIDASDLTMIIHHGPDAFEDALSIDSSQLGAGQNSSLSPVLAYDLDGAGRDDIVLPSMNTVFMNQSKPGEMKFVRRPLCDYPITVNSMNPGPSITAAVMADMNGDGIADLVVAGPNLPPTVFLGDAHGHFPWPGKPCCPQLQPDQFKEPYCITVGDVNGDGLPDLWVGQYRLPYIDGNVPKVYWDADDGYPSFLLINNGDGTFRDGTPGSGLEAKRNRRNYSASLVNLHRPGFCDLITINDFAGIDMFRNNGDGTFTDVSEQNFPNRNSFGMSHVFADFNGDGQLDLFVAGMGSTTARRLEHMKLGRADHPEQSKMRMPMAYGNRVYLGDADHVFKDAPFDDQIARTGWTWGCTALDVENDGWQDIYLTNGHMSRQSAKDYCTRFWTQDIYQGTSEQSPDLLKVFLKEDQELAGGGISWNGFEHKALLKNDHGGAFRDVAYPMNLGFEWDGREVISADLDGDGLPDILVAESQFRQVSPTAAVTWEILHVERNRSATDHHWITLRFHENTKHPPLNAIIRLKAGEREQVGILVTGDSYRSQHPLSKHFGIGTATSIDSIELDWADGAKQTIPHPEIDHELTVNP
jgi:hypothetical protein